MHYSYRCFYNRNIQKFYYVSVQWLLHGLSEGKQKMRNKRSVYTLIGLDYGDEGKGKAIASLPRMDWYCRFNGGPNAGHTIVNDMGTFKLHGLPSGMVMGAQCYIGPHCVVNPKSLQRELVELERVFPDCSSQLWIDPRCGIIEDEHIKADGDLQYPEQGSTKQGVAPAYGEYYARRARRVYQHIGEDIFLQAHIGIPLLEGNILCEGAQGINLDIHEGNYPYVTSSHCMPFMASSLGLLPCELRHTIGVCKAYSTRSGKDPHFLSEEILADKEILDKLALAGEERGTTTGRKRQVSWLNLYQIKQNIIKTDTTCLIINKIDILESVGVFKFFDIFGRLSEVSSLEDFKETVEEQLGVKWLEVIWSGINGYCEHINEGFIQHFGPDLKDSHD